MLCFKRFRNVGHFHTFKKLRSTDGNFYVTLSSYWLQCHWNGVLDFILEWNRIAGLLLFIRIRNSDWLTKIVCHLGFELDPVPLKWRSGFLIRLKLKRWPEPFYPHKRPWSTNGIFYATFGSYYIQSYWDGALELLLEWHFEMTEKLHSHCRAPLSVLEYYILLP